MSDLSKEELALSEEKCIYSQIDKASNLLYVKAGNLLSDSRLILTLIHE